MAIEYIDEESGTSKTSKVEYLDGPGAALSKVEYLDEPVKTPTAGLASALPDRQKRMADLVAISMQNPQATGTERADIYRAQTEVQPPSFTGLASGVEPPKERGWLREIGGQLIAGGAVDAPEQAGRVVQVLSPKGSAVERWGKQQVRDAASLREQDAGFAPSVNPEESPIKAGLTQGARMVAPSMGLASAVGLAAPALGVGAGMATVAGGLAGGATFGLAQGQQTFERGVEAGLSPVEAKKAAWKEGTIEAVGESVGEMLGPAKWALRGGRPLRQAGIKLIKDLATKQGLKTVAGKAALDFAKTLGSETLTEEGQQIGERLVDITSGIDKTPISADEIYQTALATIGMTTFMALLGLAGHVQQAQANNRLSKVLRDGAADPKLRTQAAKAVYEALKSENPKAAANFVLNAEQAITAGKPMVIDGSALETPKTGQSVNPEVVAQTAQTPVPVVLPDMQVTDPAQFEQGRDKAAMYLREEAQAADAAGQRDEAVRYRVVAKAVEDSTPETYPSERTAIEQEFNAGVLTRRIKTDEEKYGPPMGLSADVASEVTAGRKQEQKLVDVLAQAVVRRAQTPGQSAIDAARGDKTADEVNKAKLESILTVPTPSTTPTSEPPSGALATREGAPGPNLTQPQQQEAQNAINQGRQPVDGQSEYQRTASRSAVPENAQEVRQGEGEQTGGGDRTGPSATVEGANGVGERVAFTEPARMPVARSKARKSQAQGQPAAATATVATPTVEAPRTPEEAVERGLPVKFPIGTIKVAAKFADGKIATVNPGDVDTLANVGKIVKLLALSAKGNPAPGEIAVKKAKMPKKVSERGKPDVATTLPAGKPPELMTPNEYHQRMIRIRGVPDTADSQIKSKQDQGVDLWNAAKEKLPLNAEAVDSLKETTGPDPQTLGYVREGDRYVFKPVSPTEVAAPITTKRKIPEAKSVTEAKVAEVKAKMEKGRKELGATMAEQKQYLLDEIDKAIADAPIVGAEVQTALMPEYTKMAEAEKMSLQDWWNREESKKESAPSQVTIKVPGDGVFTLVNAKHTLMNFRKVVKARFPAKPTESIKLGSAITKLSGDESVDAAIKLYGDAEKAANTIEAQSKNPEFTEEQRRGFGSLVSELRDRASITSVPEHQISDRIKEIRVKVEAKAYDIERSKAMQESKEREQKAIEAVKNHPRYEELKKALIESYEREGRGAELPKDGDVLNAVIEGRGAPAIRSLQDAIGKDIGVPRSKAQKGYGLSKMGVFKLDRYWKDVAQEYIPEEVPVEEVIKEPESKKPTAFPNLLDFAKSRVPKSVADQMTTESQAESFRAQWNHERKAVGLPVESGASETNKGAAMFSLTDQPNESLVVLREHVQAGRLTEDVYKAAQDVTEKARKMGLNVVVEYVDKVNTTSLLNPKVKEQLLTEGYTNEELERLNASGQVYYIYGEYGPLRRGDYVAGSETRNRNTLRDEPDAGRMGPDATMGTNTSQLETEWKITLYRGLTPNTVYHEFVHVADKASGKTATEQRAKELSVRLQNGEDLSAEWRGAKFSIGQTGQGMSRADTIDAVNSASDLVGPVTVLQSESEVPAAVREQAAAKGYTGRIEGFEHQGRVYLVADNLKDARHAQARALHEAFHAGLKQALSGESRTQILNATLTKFGRVMELAGIARKYDLNLANEQDYERAMEELIAKIAQDRTSRPKVWVRFVGAVRQALRDMGLLKTMSDEDIDYLIERTLVARGTVRQTPDASPFYVQGTTQGARRIPASKSEQAAFSLDQKKGVGDTGGVKDNIGEGRTSPSPQTPQRPDGINPEVLRKLPRPEDAVIVPRADIHGNDGEYDKVSGKIFIADDLTPEHRAKTITHEMTHARQDLEGRLPKNIFVSPEESIRGFMEYLSDPSEVEARFKAEGKNDKELQKFLEDLSWAKSSKAGEWQPFEITDRIVQDQRTWKMTDAFIQRTMTDAKFLRKYGYTPRELASSSQSLVRSTGPSLAEALEVKRKEPYREGDKAQVLAVSLSSEWNNRRLGIEGPPLKSDEILYEITPTMRMEVQGKRGSDGKRNKINPILIESVLKKNGITAMAVGPNEIDIDLNESNLRAISKLQSKLLTIQDVLSKKQIKGKSITPTTLPAEDGGKFSLSDQPAPNVYTAEILQMLDKYIPLVNRAATIGHTFGKAEGKEQTMERAQRVFVKARSKFSERMDKVREAMEAKRQKDVMAARIGERAKGRKEAVKEGMMIGFKRGEAIGREMALDDTIKLGFAEIAKEGKARYMPKLIEVERIMKQLDRAGDIMDALGNVTGTKTPEQVQATQDWALGKIFGLERYKEIRRIAHKGNIPVISAVRDVLHKELATHYVKELGVLLGKTKPEKFLPQYRDAWNDATKGVTFADFSKTRWEEAKNMYERLTEIKSQSISEQQFQSGVRRADAKIAGDIAADDLSKAVKVIPGNELGTRSRRNLTKNWLIDKAGVSITRALGLSNGDVNGVAYDMLYENLKKSDTVARQFEAETIRPVTDLLKSFGVNESTVIDWRTRLTPVKVGGETVQMMVAEKMELAAAMEDPETNVMIGMNGWMVQRRKGQLNARILGETPEETIGMVQGVLNTLTTEQKQIVSLMVDQLTGMSEEANKVSVALEGWEKFTKVRYWPRKVDRSTTAQVVDMDARGQYNESLKNIGFTKERIETTHPVMTGDVFSTFFEHAHMMSKYAKLSLAVHDANVLLGQPVFASEIRARLGSGYIQNTRTMLQNLSGLRGYKDMTGAHKIADLLTRNVAVSILWFRATSIIYNRFGGSIQVFSELMHSNPKAAVRFAARTPFRISLHSADGKAIVAKLMENGYMGDRWGHDMSRVYSPLSHERAGDHANTKFKMRWRKMQEWGLKPMANAEMRNMIAVYKSLVKSGVSEQDAVQTCEDITRATQNPSTPLEESAAYTAIKGASLGWMFPFLGQPMVSRNLVVRDWLLLKNAGDKGDKRMIRQMRGALAATIIGLVGNIVLEQAVRALVRKLSRPPPDDEPELSEKVLSVLMDSASSVADFLIPGTGKVIDGIHTWFNRQQPRDSSFIGGIISKLHSGFGKLRNPYDRDDDYDPAKMEKGVMDLLEVIGNIVGGPIGGPIQYYRIGRNLSSE